MNSERHIEINGAQRAADLAGGRPLPRVSHAPTPHVIQVWPEPADDEVWVELERMLAAREAARALHPAGRALGVTRNAA